MTYYALAAFPRRELALRRPNSGFKGLIFGILGALALAAAAAWVGWYFVPAMLADADLQQNGEYAADGRVGGRCTTHRHVLTTCDVEVHYQTQDKTWRDRELHIMALGSLDQHLPLEIRYDRDDPESVGISWGFALLTNRWITFGIAETMLVIVAVVALYAGLNARATAVSLAAAIQRPEPLAVIVTGGTRARGAVTWNYRWTQDGRLRKSARTLRGRDSRPFFLDAGGREALALAGPDGRVHLIGADFDPVVLTESEMQAVRDAVLRQQGAAPAASPPSGVPDLRKR